VRAWLRRAGAQPSDVDDIIQQAYCKLSELGSVQHIRDGRAYFFTVARSMLLQRIRHERVVPIQAASDMIAEDAADHAPSPEQTVAARHDLRRVLQAIATLPRHYRDTIELRRIEGLSQKETARRLGVSEKVVENNLARGLRAVLRAMEDGQPESPPQDENDAVGHENVGGR